MNEIEFIEETDGETTVRRPATRWRNPTANEIRLPIFRGSPRPGRVPRTEEERTGIHVYTVPAGGEALIPRDYDRAVQDVRQGVVMGGLGMRLQRVDPSKVPPALHPSIDAPLPPPPMSAVDERLLARARAKAVTK
jgi:hypothetical protein